MDKNINQPKLVWMKSEEKSHFEKSHNIVDKKITLNEMSQPQQLGLKKTHYEAPRWAKNLIFFVVATPSG